MNGVHDMGGMDGFGKVEVEANEPTFHEKWEGRVMAMVRAMGANAGLNIDMQRFSRESLPPAVYLASSYYRKWFLGLVSTLVDRKLVGTDEIEAGHSLHQNAPLPKGKFGLADVQRIQTRGSFQRDVASQPVFRIGDKVRARNINPTTHTRLPRYVRGHVGTVERINGSHVFPDSYAHGGGENPQWLYTVVFTACELWGEEAPDPTAKISVDAFEPYLETA
ncbi:MAG TPA: nitrile hydratase subunit beta [Reyranella sp.]|nr:nitrile hydratase subunit beta [Reyranella sp.]